MAFDIGTIRASIKLDYDSKGLSQLDSDMKKAGKSADQLESRTSRLGGKLKSGLKVGALAAGAAIGTGLAVSLRTAIEEAREAERTTKQTEAVLKSTGNTANTSAKQIEKLATSISNKVGIDDEAVQSTSNLLLTFKNIQNSADGTSKTFDRATMAVVDMSAAMTRAAPTTESMKSASIQLGKALNDPIKGMAALGRVGIQFSEQQKTQIEQLVESGNLQKAQAIILREVESQFAGSAAAQTTAIDKLQTSWNNFLEVIGLKLTPIIDKAAKWLSKFLQEMQAGRGAGGEFRQTLENVWESLKGLWPAIKGVANIIGDLISWFSKLSGPVQTAIVAFGGFLSMGLKLAAFFRLAPLLMGPVGLAIAAIGTAAILIIQNWDKVKKFLGNVWGWIKNAAADLGRWVADKARKGFLGPLPLIISRWQDILGFIKQVPGKVGNFLSGLGRTILAPYKWAYEKITGVLDRLLEKVKSVFNKIKEQFTKLKDAYNNYGGEGNIFFEAGQAIAGRRNGGPVGPGAGGARLFLAGEGNKKEWVISQEGDRKRNQGWVMEAASALGIPGFKKGGKPNKKPNQKPNKKPNRPSGGVSPSSLKPVAGGGSGGNAAAERINRKIANLQQNMALKRREFELSGGVLTTGEIDRLIALNKGIENAIRELIGVTKGQAKKDARFALRDAQLSRQDLIAERQGITSGSAQLAQEAFTQTPGVDALIDDLSTQLALAEAGYGGNPDNIRSQLKQRLEEKLAILRQKLSGTSNRDQISVLNDAIRGTLGELSGLGTGGIAGPSFIEQVATAASLRYDAFSNFGSNAMQMGLGAGGRTLAKAGGTTVVLNGEFKLDGNDPHSSVRKLGYQIANNLA